MEDDETSKFIAEGELRFKAGLKDLVNEMSDRIRRGEPGTPMDYYQETIRLAKSCFGPYHDPLLAAGRIHSWIQTYLAFVQISLLLEIYYGSEKME